MPELQEVPEITILTNSPKLVEEKDEVYRAYQHFNPEDLMIPPILEDLEAKALEIYKNTTKKTIIGSCVKTVTPVPISKMGVLNKPISLLTPPVSLPKTIGFDKKCPIIMKSGPRAGQLCDKPFARNNTICSYHVRQTSKL